MQGSLIDAMILAGKGSRVVFFFFFGFVFVVVFIYF